MTGPTTPGVTTGTDQREPRPVDPALAAFDLQQELTRLQGEPGWTRDGHAARTLAKAPSYRVVLAIIQAGRSIGDDDAHGPLTLQVLDGQAEVRRGDEPVAAPPGALVWVAPGASWACGARTDVGVLLSYAWPEERASSVAGDVGSDAAIR